jgi:RecB family exonuclease
VQSAEQRAFFAAALAWTRRPDERHASRMLHSPFSGVPQELGAAYATLAAREGNLLDRIAQERLLAPFGNALRALSNNKDEDAARAEIERLFAFDDSPHPVAASPGDAFALCEPAVPEPRMGIRASRARFSASQLNAYVECSRKWFYRYMCGAVEDKGSSASFYGTAFHAALEKLHGEFPRPGDADPAQLALKLEGLVNSAFDSHRNNFETPVEFELQRRRAQRTAKKYVEWLLAEAKRSSFTVVGCELSAELEMEGFEFIGYIDRLDRDDKTGAVAVIDYKTGTIAASAAEYREKIRQFKDFQLPFYYWARTAQGDRVWKLALLPLKDALLDVAPIVLEVVPVPSEIGRSPSATGVIPLSELERARDRMIELCAELTAGNATAFPVTADPAACTYCAYAIACAHKPYAPDLRFGR